MQFSLAYETYGKLNSNKDNAHLFHVLTYQFVTGTNPITNKEGGVIAAGPNKALDTDKYFVIVPRVIGIAWVHLVKILIQ